ncbi:MAG: T9SS type A sorting domain-containing protein [Haliscomenobacter sp.]|nr:T9SS type A sorting domain-containing protein [Haliscomenobacter sp.]
MGEYRVWGVTYTGIFLAAPGADADLAPLSDNCFSLTSNFVTINVMASSGLSNAWIAAQGPGKEERPRLFLNAAPNPVADVLQIGFSVENLQAGEAQLHLFSLNGELLRVQKIQPLAGYNTARLDMSSLTDGVYFLRLFHQGAQETLRVVKITRP